MSEPSPATQYIVNEHPVQIVHRCPGCDEVIGAEIERDGRVYLLIGSRLTPYLPPGICAVCGRNLLAWEPGWRKLAAAIKRLRATTRTAGDEVRRAAEEAGDGR